MAIITLLFLLYIFLPSGPDKNGKNGKNPHDPNNTGNKRPLKKLPDDPTGAEKLEQLNVKIQNELVALYGAITSSPDPFNGYSTEGLEKLPALFESNLVDKLYKFSFSDLKDVGFPENYSGPLKFNLYLSAFLLKLKQEEIEKKVAVLPWDQFQKMVDFSFYKLINNEVEADYQWLPVLFYFKQVANRLNVYPWLDVTAFFKERTEKLRDLSTAKYLVKIRELLLFSERPEQYRLEWREHDGLGPDDKKQYPNLTFKTFTFLKQEYLVFPEEIGPDKNQWLKDIYKSDPGSIELIKLNIRNINPTRQSELRKIIYTPVNSRFVALLREYKAEESGGFLDRLMARAMGEYHKSYTVVPFSPDEIGEEDLEDALIVFGKFLKKNRHSIEEK
jgi:hypothetical protein